MTLTQRLRHRVNALMAARGWTSNRQVIDASNRRLTNGTLGRLRSDHGENVRLTVLEDLGHAFGVEPWELLAPATSPATPAARPDWASIARTLAGTNADDATRLLLLDFCRRVDAEYAIQVETTCLPGKFTIAGK